MNSLLKRQIRKFLPKELRENKNLELFLDAINRSYSNSDEQFTMLQRATSISSAELFTANNKLKEESNSQRVVIDKLEGVIDKLQPFNLRDKRPKENADSLKLVNFIDNQTQEIIKINQQKDKLLKNLELQNQDLNDYTHMVSHDLRSPLQSIEALTSWIQEDYKTIIDAPGKEILQLIRNNVLIIDTLVKGTLEYATIGKIENKFSKVAIEKLVKNILNKIGEKNNVKVRIPIKLPIIIGDKYRLEKLFFHIIDNAIKYTDKETIIIEIGFSEDEDYWNFYVKDNGIGINEKYFDKVFIAFQKLESNNNSVGLGLAVVKKIIGIYNGQIWIESKLNLGTTFYFNLKK
jgi:light-regulated signal transduction histidine kinase (bacteriophytochrome)